jgi:hypothetical protein
MFSLFFQFLKRLALPAALLCLSGIQAAQGQEAGWFWARSAGGTGQDEGLAIHTHNSSTVYTGGRFTGNVQFGSTLLFGNGQTDGFVARYSNTGDAVWAMKIGGIGNDVVTAVCSDGNGNVYVTGSFEATANLNGTLLTSAGGRDIFIAKYSALGDLLWARRAGGTGDEYGTGITSDAAGNIYVTGAFSDSLQVGALAKLYSAGAADAFVAAYNTNGNEQWSKRGGGTQNDIPAGIIVDASGLYTTGTYSGTASFGGNNLTAAGGSDIWTVKYTVGGVEQWARSTGSKGNDIADAISLDGFNAVLIAGTVADTITAGSITVAGKGGTDIFAAKYTQNGNEIWVRLYGNTQNDRGMGISADATGNILLAGLFRGTVTFGSGSLNAMGGSDIAIIRLDSSGAVQWSQQAGSAGDDDVQAIAQNTNRGAYIAGSYGFQAQFGKITLNGRGGQDFYIAQILNTGANDAGIVSIGVPAPPFAPGNQTVTAQIKNYGTRRIDSVQLEWRINGIVQPLITYRTALEPGQTGSVTLGTANFPAARLTEIRATTLLPNSAADNNTANDAELLNAGPGLLKGIYTVGGTLPDFPTVAIAARYISRWGILDSVIFSVRSGSYGNEQVILGQIPGASATKTVLFTMDAAALTRPDISFEALYPENDYVLLLDGTDWVNFRKMDFSSLGNNYGRVAVLRNGTQNIGFDSIFFEVSPTAAAGNMLVESSNSADGLQILNSSFEGGLFGLKYEFDTLAMPVTGLMLKNNLFTGFRESGIRLMNTDDPQIDDNDFIPGVNASSAIWMYETYGSGTLRGNLVNELLTGTAIQITMLRGDTLIPWLISNNMIRCGSSTTTATGFLLADATYAQFYHNTIRNASAITGRAALETQGGNQLDIQNNLFYNAGGGYSVAYRYSGARPALVSNYNLLFTTGSNLALLSDGTNTWTAADLALWKAAPIRLDSMSASKAVAFAPDLLHLTVVDQPLYGNLAISAIVKRDFDGQLRKNAYMGADEIIPVITIDTQPQRITACLGTTAEFNVSARISNGGTLRYQWFKDGQPIADSTRAQLSLKNINFANEGFYRCRLIGNSGADTVFTATVQLIAATRTTILRPPQTQYVQRGGTAIFEVAAEAGAIPPRNLVNYRWFRDTVEFTDNTDRITGVNTDRLVIQNIQPADTGAIYSVIVEGACGKDTARAFGIFMPGVLFTAQPRDTAVCAGDTVRLSANVVPTIAGLELQYQWRKGQVAVSDNQRISGANTPVLKIAGLTTADSSSQYVLEVILVSSNSRFFSQPAKALLYTPTAILTQPRAQEACPGKPFSISVVAQGTGLQYQWQRNDTNIAGAINSTFTIDTMNQTLTGRYRVVVSGLCGTRASDAVTIKSRAPLQVLVQPQKDYVSNLGRTLTLSVEVAGATPFTFEWFHNGIKDPVNEDNIFFRPNAQIQDTGLYWCRISNSCDTIYSDTVRVRLVPVSVQDDKQDAAGAEFAGLYPNPAQNSSVADFTTSGQGMVRLVLSDMLGRVITPVFEGVLSAGNYRIPFSTSNLPNGSYMCTVYSQGMARSRVLIISN